MVNLVDTKNCGGKKNEGGVTVEVKKTGAKVQIIVKDIGTGIPKEQIKTLFDRAFVRGKEAKKVHGYGRGIGVLAKSGQSQKERTKEALSLLSYR